MALFLVQHGKSLPKDLDPEKGLSAEGISETERIAGVAKGYAVNVAVIRHSGKKRAAQTADIFAAALKPEGGVEEISGIKPLDDVAAFAEKLSAESNVMLVGHLPFMERLTSWLILQNTEPCVFRFQNSGIVCLDEDPDTDAWVIRWTLMPNIA
ncbi:MAG: phosphohistidine phosphatase SixA [Desulfobacteraceae bacterium 4572_88]|nr:MAG: phosphohistidine phosphatase SixA [Desulfobacteraceae bacterium 4572_88]